MSPGGVAELLGPAHQLVIPPNAGGDGNDTYVLDNPADVIIENPSEGIDSVRAAFTYTLAADLENRTRSGVGTAHCELQAC